MYGSENSLLDSQTSLSILLRNYPDGFWTFLYLNIYIYYICIWLKYKKNENYIKKFENLKKNIIKYEKNESYRKIRKSKKKLVKFDCFEIFFTLIYKVNWYIIYVYHINVGEI